MTIRQRMAGRSRNGIRAGIRNTRPELEAIYEKAVARVGAERAKKMAHFDHHILIFPNLAIVDNHGIMIRTYFSKKPAEMLVQSWTHRAAGGIAGNPQAPAVQLHGLPGPGRLRHAGRRRGDRGGAARLQGRGGLRRLERHFRRRRAEGSDELREARRRGPDAGVLDQVAGIYCRASAGSSETMRRKKASCGARRSKRRQRDASDDALSSAQGRHHSRCRSAARNGCASTVLRKRYDAGASPLREALNRLSAEGFVVQKDQRGFVVADINESSLSTRLIFTRCSLNEIMLPTALQRGDQAWEERVVLAHYHLSKTPPFTSDGRVNEDYLASSPRIPHVDPGALRVALAAWSCRKSCSTGRSAIKIWRLRGDMVGSRDVAGEHNDLVKAVLSRDAARSISLLNEHVRTTGQFARSAESDNASLDGRRSSDGRRAHRRQSRTVPDPTTGAA